MWGRARPLSSQLREGGGEVARSAADCMWDPGQVRASQACLSPRGPSGSDAQGPPSPSGTKIQALAPHQPSWGSEQLPPRPLLTPRQPTPCFQALGLWETSWGQLGGGEVAAPTSTCIQCREAGICPQRPHSEGGPAAASSRCAELVPTGHKVQKTKDSSQ